MMANRPHTEILTVPRSQIFLDRARLALRQRPVNLIGNLTVIAAGIGLHDAGIHRKAFALDQTCIHTGAHHRFEHMAQDVAGAEAAMAIDRKRRVIGDLVVEVEPAKPSVGQVQFDFLTQPPLKANAEAVTHDQHPDHQLWINRRPANLAVERYKLLPKLGQDPRHHRINPAQQMTRRNTPFEVEKVK
jgi:hypothetical protein